MQITSWNLLSSIFDPSYRELHWVPRTSWMSQSAGQLYRRHHVPPLQQEVPFCRPSSGLKTGTDLPRLTQVITWLDSSKLHPLRHQCMASHLWYRFITLWSTIWIFSFENVCSGYTREMRNEGNELKFFFLIVHPKQKNNVIHFHWMTGHQPRTAALQRGHSWGAPHVRFGEKSKTSMLLKTGLLIKHRWVHEGKWTKQHGSETRTVLASDGQKAITRYTALSVCPHFPWPHLSMTLRWPSNRLSWYCWLCICPVAITTLASVCPPCRGQLRSENPDLKTPLGNHPQGRLLSPSTPAPC